MSGYIYWMLHKQYTDILSIIYSYMRRIHDNYLNLLNSFKSSSSQEKLRLPIINKTELSQTV